LILLRASSLLAIPIQYREDDMNPTRLLLTAALGLSVIACTQPQTNRTTTTGTTTPSPPITNSPQDLAYCAKLSQLYLRYVGADPNSGSFDGVTPDVIGGEAVAKCREGDAKASIPTLERLLKDADMTLPPRT
jgi:hypothetical protein